MAEDKTAKLRDLLASGDDEVASLRSESEALRKEIADFNIKLATSVEDRWSQYCKFIQ
jgi:hypothetical protein